MGDPPHNPAVDQSGQSAEDRYIKELLANGLDRYAIHGLLGKGGMGEVYLGVHRTIEKKVAIKTLSYKYREDPGLNARFLREAKAASKIRNQHIVDITDFGETPQGCSYFAMEWLEGEDLSKTLKREGALPWPRAREILVQILEALQAAHDAGVIHRDIKPANCFRITQGRNPDFIKVLDFGIARAPGEHGEALTGTGMILGTADYIAPEQGRAEKVDARTDIYAVGVMMFEMLTGRRPFKGRTAIELVSKHLTEMPPSLLATATQPLPAQLDHIVASCLAKDPARRYGSATSLIDALLAVGDAPAPTPNSLPPHAVMSTQLAPPTSPTYATTTAPPRQGPPGWLIGTLIAGVVAALGVGAVFALRATSQDPSTAPEEAPAVAAASDSEDTPSKPTPAAAGADTLVCADGMVLLSGGSFFMGADAESKFLQSARPQFKVDVKPFCLDRHEVTVTEYRDCSRQGECRRAYRDSDWPQGSMESETWTLHKKVFSELCNERATGRGDHPVNCIDYEQAQTYCKHLGKRLPTEAEWEFAARGSDGRDFPWGDNAPTERLANACGIECKNWRAEQGLEDTGTMFETDDGYVGTAPVERFEDGATASGLFDMVGNVFEWTSSDFLPYTKDGYGQPESGAPARKVIRGGAFNSGHADFARPAMRAAMDPAAHTHGIGVRCAAEPTAP